MKKFFEIAWLLVKCTFLTIVFLGIIWIGKRPVESGKWWGDFQKSYIETFNDRDGVTDSLFIGNVTFHYADSVNNQQMKTRSGDSAVANTLFCISETKEIQEMHGTHLGTIEIVNGIIGSDLTDTVTCGIK